MGRSEDRWAGRSEDKWADRSKDKWAADRSKEKGAADRSEDKRVGRGEDKRVGRGEDRWAYRSEGTTSGQTGEDITSAWSSTATSRPLSFHSSTIDALEDSLCVSEGMD